MSTVEKIKHKGKKLTKQASEKMLQAKKAVTSSKKKKKLTAEEEEALMRSMELKEGEEDPAVKRLRGD